MTVCRRIMPWWAIIPNGGIWGILSMSMIVARIIADRRDRDSTSFRMHVDRVDIGIRRRGFAFRLG